MYDGVKLLGVDSEYDICIFDQILFDLLEFIFHVEDCWLVVPEVLLVVDPLSKDTIISEIFLVLN